MGVPSRMPGIMRLRSSSTRFRTSRWPLKTSTRSICGPALATCWSYTGTYERLAARDAMRRAGWALAALRSTEIEHGCGGYFRPDIVWFGESLPGAVWRESETAAARAEVILVVGTSAVVYPAAALATQYNGRALVAEINPERTAISDRVDCVLHGTAAALLPEIVARFDKSIEPTAAGGREAR